MEQTTAIEHELLYRLYEQGDEEGILRLWKEESGWGAITMQQFKEWFIDTPYGDCLIVVAVDETNEVRGQIIYAPSRMIVGGEVIRSLRGAAPIIDSSIRQASLSSAKHPAMSLIKNGFAIAAEKGFQFVYSFPAFGWIGLIRMFPRLLPNPTENNAYDCFAVSLDAAETIDKIRPEYKTSLVKNFTAEHEELWMEMVKQLPVHCALHRQEKLMNRLAGDAIKIETRSVTDGRLIGYTCIKKDGLMIDLVARNQSDLQTVFEQSVFALHFSNANRIEVPFSKVKGMITKETEVVLQNIPFAKDDYRFAYAGYLLDTTLDFEKFKSSNWYMMPLG